MLRKRERAVDKAEKRTKNYVFTEFFAMNESHVFFFSLYKKWLVRPENIKFLLKTNHLALPKKKCFD